MDCDVFIAIGMLDIRCGLDVGTGETSLNKRNSHNVGKKDSLYRADDKDPNQALAQGSQHLKAG